MYFTSVESDSIGLLPECNVGVKEAWNKVNSSWSVHGNLTVNYLVTHKLVEEYLWMVCAVEAHAQTMFQRFSSWFVCELSPCICSHSSCSDWQQTVTSHAYCVLWHKLQSQACPMMMKCISLVLSDVKPWIIAISVFFHRAPFQSLEHLVRVSCNYMACTHGVHACMRISMLVRVDVHVPYTL